MVSLDSGCCRGHKEQNKRHWSPPSYHLQRRSAPSPRFLHGAAPGSLISPPGTEPRAHVCPIGLDGSVPREVASLALRGAPERPGTREPARQRSSLHWQPASGFQSHRPPLGWPRGSEPGSPRPPSASVPRGPDSPFRPSVVRSTAAPRLPQSPPPRAHNKATPGPAANAAPRKNSFAPSFPQPWPPGLTTPSRRAADSQPPSYHPTTAAAQAAGNFRSPRHRPLEWA